MELDGDRTASLILAPTSPLTPALAKKKTKPKKKKANKTKKTNHTKKKREKQKHSKKRIFLDFAYVFSERT